MAYVITSRCVADYACVEAGEELRGSFAADQVVGWYNGHPDRADLALDLAEVRRAVVIGNGNVAIGVARILARSPDALAATDIADPALAALRTSGLEEVVVLARRGPVDAAFTAPELEQLAGLPDVDVVIEGADPAAAEHTPGSDARPEVRRKHELIAQIARRAPRDGVRRIVLRFCASPLEILGADRVIGLRVAENDLVRGDDGRTRARASERTSVLDAELVVRATGHRGRPVGDLPFHDDRGTVRHWEGRVEDCPGIYVAGWIKRGATGVVGTNKKCARDSVRCLLGDLAAGITSGYASASSGTTVVSTLRRRRPDLVTTEGWRAIDAHERAAGRSQGRPRVKLTRLPALLEQANHRTPASSERSGSSGTPRWDVIVLGSGLGGMSSAACLAASGKSVLVLEQHDIVGGCSQVFRRNGVYEFDCGVHYVGGCVPGSDGLIPTVLRGLGVEDRVQWSRMDDYGMDTALFPDHTFRIPPGWDRWIENLRETFPADADGLTSAVNELRYIGESADRINDVPHSVSAVLPLSKRPWEVVSLVKALEQPMTALIRRHQLSTEAGVALLSMVHLHNTAPERTPILLTASLLQHYFKAGAYFPLHGGQVLSANLLEVIESHGGTVLTKHRVSSIDVESGRAVGVRLDDGRAIRSDIVISNADAHRTYLDLLGVDKLPARMHRRIKRFRRPHSIFATYIAADVDLSHTRPATNYLSHGRYDMQITYDLMDRGQWDPKGWLAISSPTLKTWGRHEFGLPGHSTIECFMAVPGEYEFWGGGDPMQGPGYRDSRKYQDRKQEIEDVVMERTVDALPELDGHITWQESATPLSHERYTLSRMPYGPENSKDQIGPFRRLPATTAIKGLYLAGASTSYQYGIAFTLRGGVGTTSEILGRDLMRDFHRGHTLVDPHSLPTQGPDWDPFEASRGRSRDDSCLRSAVAAT